MQHIPDRYCINSCQIRLLAVLHCTHIYHANSINLTYTIIKHLQSKWLDQKKNKFLNHIKIFINTLNQSVYAF